MGSVWKYISTESSNEVRSTGVWLGGEATRIVNQTREKKKVQIEDGLLRRHMDCGVSSASDIISGNHQCQ